jgi:hypothetical protein
MIDSEPNRYRWLGRRNPAAGAALVRVRQASVAATWQPVGVEWVPETSRRPACDFPIFYSIVRCFSRRALAALSTCIEGGVEVLGLDGLEGDYAGVHCIRWIEGAADLSGIDPSKVSIHSANFVPRLKAHAVAGYDIFGVPEMITKLFVGERFKDAVERNGLVGLEFKEVELC